MSIAAFDIGGTALKWASAPLQANCVKKASSRLSIAMATRYCKRCWRGLPLTRRVKAWRSARGYVNPHTGFIEMGGAIRKFDNFAIKRWLEQQTGLPVAIENDANCVLLAERWRGKAAEMSDFLVLTIGTGIGGAIFCNNRLVHGASFRAGDLAICRPIVRAPAMCAAIQ